MLTALLALSLAAPVPKGDKKEPPFFPVTVGAAWVMHTQGGKDTTDVTETVSKVAERDGVYTVTVERSQAGRGMPKQVFEVSAAGVARLTSAGRVTKTPYRVLDLGVKAGDTWTTDVEPPVGKSKHTMGREEEVETPAGKFTALRVETVSDADDEKFTSWHVKGVGVVRVESDRGGRKTVREMKEFTPGKDTKDDKKKEEPKKDE